MSIENKPKIDIEEVKTLLEKISVACRNYKNLPIEDFKSYWDLIMYIESRSGGVVSRPVKVVDFDGVERIGGKLLAGETAYTSMSTDPAVGVVTVFVGKTN